MYSTEEIMHRQTLVNKRNILRRGLTATESCTEHSGTFNRRLVGIEVEGKIHNVRTYENVRRIFFKYIFIFLVQINRKNAGRILWFMIIAMLWFIPSQGHVTVYNRKVTWRGHCALATFCHWEGPRNSTSWTSHNESRGRICYKRTLCCTNQIKKYALTQGSRHVTLPRYMNVPPTNAPFY